MLCTMFASGCCPGCMREIEPADLSSLSGDSTPQVSSGSSAKSRPTSFLASIAESGLSAEVAKDVSAALTTVAASAAVRRFLSPSTEPSLEGIDLIVFGMAGTVMQEGDRICFLLQNAMQGEGLQVSDEALSVWHGAKMDAVVRHFAQQAGIPEMS